MREIGKLGEDAQAREIALGILTAMQQNAGAREELRRAVAEAIASLTM